MRKKVKKISWYHFDGAAQIDVSSCTPECISYYDDNGLVTHALEWGERVSYTYDSHNSLVKLVRDKDDSVREIREYSYDPDGALLCIHMEERERGPHYLPKYQNVALYNPEFFARDDDDQFEPTGYYIDVWNYWENNGDVCQQEVTIHHPDGAIEKIFTHEEYKETHVVLRQWSDFEEGERVKHLEKYCYDEDGKLVKAELTDNNNDKHHPFIREIVELYDEHENVKEEFNEGLLARTYEYTYNDEGIWIRKTCRDAMGFLICEDVRIIEYDEATA